MGKIDVASYTMKIIKNENDKKNQKKRCCKWTMLKCKEARGIKLSSDYNIKWIINNTIDYMRE